MREEVKVTACPDFDIRTGRSRYRDIIWDQLRPVTMRSMRNLADQDIANWRNVTVERNREGRRVNHWCRRNRIGFTWSGLDLHRVTSSSSRTTVTATTDATSVAAAYRTAASNSAPLVAGSHESSLATAARVAAGI